MSPWYASLVFVNASMKTKESFYVLKERSIHMPGSYVLLDFEHALFVQTILDKRGIGYGS